MTEEEEKYLEEKIEAASYKWEGVAVDGWLAYIRGYDYYDKEKTNDKGDGTGIQKI